MITYISNWRSWRKLFKKRGHEVKKGHPRSKIPKIGQISNLFKKMINYISKWRSGRLLSKSGLEVIRSHMRPQIFNLERSERLRDLGQPTTSSGAENKRYWSKISTISTIIKFGRKIVQLLDSGLLEQGWSQSQKKTLLEKALIIF